jgi:hypothetical protein
LSRDFRPEIFAEIRSSRIFKDYFLRAGNNETKKETKEEKNTKNREHYFQKTF